MKIKILLLIVTLGLTVTNGQAQSASISSISFQAALNGTNGLPLPNGNYNLTFRFWDVPSPGGNPISTNIPVPNVSISGGIASTVIPVDPSWFNGQTRYLGISVNGGAELSPRTLVTAVPYAVTAQSVNGSQGAFVAGNFYGPAHAGQTRVLSAFSDFSGIDVGADSVNFSLSDGGITNCYTAFNYKWAGGEFDLIHSIWQGWPILRVDGSVGSGPTVRISSTNSTEPLIVDAYRIGLDNVPGASFNYFDSGLNASTQINYKDSPGFFKGLQFIRCIWAGQPVFTVRDNTDGPLVGIGTDDPQTALDVRGTARMTVCQITSDRNVKNGFQPVSDGDMLTKLAAMPISTWCYTNSPNVRHIGPMAQDFANAFGVGEDDKHIATVDADGVALAAIQGLNQKLEQQLREKDSQIGGLEKRLSSLEYIISSMSEAHPQ